LEVETFEGFVKSIEELPVAEIFKSEDVVDMKEIIESFRAKKMFVGVDQAQEGADKTIITEVPNANTEVRPIQSVTT